MTSPRPATARPFTLLPLGGDASLARRELQLHPLDPWTGQCGSCGDAHPCRRREAQTMLGGSAGSPPRGQVALIAARAPAALLLLAAALAWGPL